MDPCPCSRLCRFLLRVPVLLALGLPLSLVRGDLVRVANTTLNLPANLPSATGYQKVNALGSLTFSAPIATTYPAGETNRLYVVQRGGSIRVVNNLSTTPAAATFMNLATYLSAAAQNTPLNTGGECGLLAMAFHPNYNQNGYFYLYYSIDAGGQLYQRLARFQATGTAGNYNAATSANPATQLPMLSMIDNASNHNGGDLAFGADGYLYLSLGDEGNANDSFNNARFINKKFWGQLLRLDVDNKPGNLTPNPQAAVHAGTYRVPADNPFIGYTSWHGQAIAANTVRTEIYATGLRNPFRFSIDPATGRIFLGDVGQGTYEEIDIIVKGGDYGWSWREGLHPFGSPPAPTSPPAGYTTFRKDPIFEYDHANNGAGDVIFGDSVMGGVVYRGNELPELYGKYLFGDNGTGIVAALTENANGTWTGQRLLTSTAVVGSLAHFGTDPHNGETLMCSLGGTIYKLVRSGTTGTNPPATLSATGAFSDVATLTPNAGIVPYEPNVDFWSDYAQKTRWFAIKNTSDTMTYSVSGNWAFPTGQVWIKHFDIETERGNSATKRKLETRFLVKTVGGVYGLSYKWRADQTEADLVAESGLSEVIPSSSPVQTWRYPSRSECITCHSGVAGHALSFNSPQLNRAHDYGGVPQNQIQALSDAGYLSAPVTGIGSLPAYARADDAGASLEWRVRSFLAVNCSQCHQPGGGSQGNWDARSTMPIDSANIVNGLLINNGGDNANRFVVPGDPGHTMLLNRLQGAGFTRMPPLATSERDLVSEQLVTNWVNSFGPLVNGVLAIDLPAGSTLLVNEGGTVQIPIIRTVASEGTVGFTITTIDGSAVSGSDYVPPVTPQTVGDGVTSMTVPIDIPDPGGTSEPNEAFTVTISAPTGGSALGAVTSVTVRIVDSADGMAPSAPVISTPTAGQLLSLGVGAPYNVTGTAKDDKGVGRVQVKLNNDSFVDATLASPGAPSTGWSIPVVPESGVNTLTAQTRDTQDVPSATVTTRTFSVLRPLVVTPDPGLGTMSAGFSPSSDREVGKSYTVTAMTKPPTTTPAFAGSIFNGWEIGGQDVANGGVPFTLQRIGVVASALQKQTLTFIFHEGLTLSAHFLLNPFPPVAGSYNGLIRPSGTEPDRDPPASDGTARTNATEGRFIATVMYTGAFSGSLSIDGLTLNLAGAFDGNGDARFGTARLPTQTVPRPNKPSLVVALHLDPGATPADAKITGSVRALSFLQSGEQAVSRVDSDRAYYNGTTILVPPAYLGTGNANGLFTAVLTLQPPGQQPPNLTARDIPQGRGIGTVTVTKAGVVSFAGTAADGSALSASSPLSHGNAFPLFVVLYSKLGFISGYVQLDAIASSDMTATGLKWLRPFQGRSHYYPYGWPEVLQVDLKAARYAALAGQGVLKAADGTNLGAADEDGNVELTFSSGQLSEALHKFANVSTADVVTKVPGNDPSFTLVINRATGAISGTFTHTNDTVPLYRGVVYQKGPNAGAQGFFLTPPPVPIDYTGESGGVEVKQQ